MINIINAIIIETMHLFFFAKYFRIVTVIMLTVKQHSKKCRHELSDYKERRIKIKYGKRSVRCKLASHYAAGAHGWDWDCLQQVAVVQGQHFQKMN